MQPRANVYALAQFMGNFPTVREAVGSYTAQKRGMGESLNLLDIFERLEKLLRRELQLTELAEDAIRNHWRSQYGYVRAVLAHIREDLGNRVQLHEKLRQPKFQVGAMR